MLHWITVSGLFCTFDVDNNFDVSPFSLCPFDSPFHSTVNLRKVCNYIQQRSKVDFQCIVISLKDMFYERSESLVGICKDVGTNSSRTLTLDLTQFDKKEEAGKGSKRKAKSEGVGRMSRKRPTPDSPGTIATQ